MGWPKIKSHILNKAKDWLTPYGYAGVKGEMLALCWHQARADLIVWRAETLQACWRQKGLREVYRGCCAADGWGRRSRRQSWWSSFRGHLVGFPLCIADQVHKHILIISLLLTPALSFLPSVLLPAAVMRHVQIQCIRLTGCVHTHCSLKIN